MKRAFKRVKVPLFAILGIFLITVISFATVNPDAFQVGGKNTITGNAMLDQILLYDGRFSQELPCSNLDDPVCATDGKTYRNLCLAQKAGADMRHQGRCDGGWEVVE